LAEITIILVAQNLITRVLIACLEAEIFKFKSYLVNLARNPPIFFTLSFIAENSSLLFAVQSNHLIDSSCLGGLGIPVYLALTPSGVDFTTIPVTESCASHSLDCI